MPVLTDFGPLRSKRLVLRPWRDADVPIMHAMCQDLEIQRWSGMPGDFGPEAVSTYINVTLAAQAAAGSGVAFAIELADTGEVAGSVGLYGVADRSERSPAQASVREWVAAGYRKDGYATEALDLLVRHAFSDLGLERITAYARAGNAVSRSLTERVGFQGRAVLRSAIMHDGHPADIWYSDLLPSDLGPDRGSPAGS